MKRFVVLLFLLSLFSCCFSQIKWSNDTIPFSQVEWDNYSTSFYDSNNKASPLLVTAIPYNGVYNYGNDVNSAIDLSSRGSLYRFRSELSGNFRELNTYDSFEVYFLAPGIFRSNANQYEYCVLLNGTTTIRPWNDIHEFTDKNFQLNNFQTGMGYLGGYKTTWGNYLVVQLRKKGSTTTLSAAVVKWTAIKPVLFNIYTLNELNEYLSRLKNPRDFNIGVSKKWKSGYGTDELDSSTFLPKKLRLTSKEDHLIFDLQADVYKREALEYELIKDGAVSIPWKANDFDNNFIWLKNLTPGDYLLHIRFRAQRHHVTEYAFEIKPAWHQTTAFKVIMGSLIAAFFGFIIVSFRLIKQKQKAKTEDAKKEKLHLQLKAIRSQLNPHFVFNALSSIQGLINKSDITGANEYLSRFGNLMRNALTGSDKDMTVLDGEIAMLETYLRLEQLRFRFQYSIQVDENIQTSEIEIPTLLLQPLVENAVKHGASPLQEKGIIHIHLKTNDNDIIVLIQDNGNGFQPEQNNNGYGLRLTGERVKLLNQILKEQSIEFSINGTSGTKTVACLLFKNWLL